MSREVPDGWTPVKLGAAASNVAEKWEPGEHAEPYVGLEQLDQGTGRLLDIGVSDDLQSIKTRFRAGDVLFGKLRPNLRKTALVDFSGIASTDILVIRPSERMTPEFAFYRLSSDEAFDYAIKSAAGTKMPRTSWKDMADFEFPLPPLHEQRRIAEILSSVDEAIAATRAVIEQTRTVKQGVLERLLTKGIGHTRFKQTEIGEIPEGWEVAELIDVSDAITVGIASSATHAYRSDGIPLLRNQNIKAGVLDLADLLFVSPEYDAENASKRVKTGDVVSMRTGYPGRSAVIPPELDGCQTFTTLVTKPKPSRINSDFLCAWINSDGGMKQVRRLQAGGAQQNLNAGVLKRLLVPLPPLTEQQQIASSAQSLLFDEEREIGALSELKSALMSDLLTGRKRVTDALPLAAE